MADYDGSPLTYPPLGLPSGSVRALLTLSCVAVVVVNTARAEPLDPFWSEALLISMAHYFTSRRFIHLPSSVIRQLEQDQVIERETQPLFLPRGSIRVMIIAAFIGLGVYLYRTDPARLRSVDVITLLVLVGAYFLGAIVRAISSFLNRWRTRPPSRFWADSRALIVLIAMAAVAIPDLLGAGNLYAEQSTVRHIALGLMLFYFGSR